jgi:hypothetical protein
VIVYVDELRTVVDTQRTAQWKWSEACHLFADTERELHAFAARLGLLPGGFSVGGSFVACGGRGSGSRFRSARYTGSHWR